MLREHCNSCDEDFTLAMDETIINVYEEVHFNHVYTRCENCLTPMVLFFAEPEFLTTGYPVCYNDEVPWVVQHIWAQLNDPDNLPEDPRQTPDQQLDEWEERRFHDWLEEITPADFEGI